MAESEIVSPRAQGLNAKPGVGKLGRFLDQPFAGYRHARRPAYDDSLQRVGPGTPGGEYLRRFWHPVAHADGIDDRPVPIRILGEDLVVFRDKAGRVGLLERHCAHRGTSLEFGKIEERGIRCCYHAWLFDVDGKILETPHEGEAGPYQGKLCQGAYPTVELNGLVFAYMGPPEKQPPFPYYDVFEQAGMVVGRGEAAVEGNVKPCNWLQIMDNVVDQVHEPFLHARMTGLQFLDKNGRPVVELMDLGEPDWFETPLGILCHEARRVGESVWIRSMECILPNIALVCDQPVLPPEYPAGEKEIRWLPLLTRWRVPVDDETTTEFAFIYHPRGGENRYITNPIPGTRSNYGDRPYEERQRFPGDFDAQVGQGALANHGSEHLASSDRGVAMLRRMVREGIDAVREGADPKGVVRGTTRDIPTYTNEIIQRVPAAASPEAERELLHRLSREHFERSVAQPPVLAIARATAS